MVKVCNGSDHRTILYMIQDFGLSIDVLIMRQAALPYGGSTDFLMAQASEAKP